ncbi:hypothetical protein [Nonomuraea dietziae]|uniref:hypothetical protein n=1 Tax=Nonomuraea dietziae TaxID=65515 RepID=UPI0034070C39
MALIAAIVWFVRTRDWRLGVALLGYVAGWLPWIYFALANNRTMYLFYMAPILPFMVLAMVLTVTLVFPERAAVALGVITLVTAANLWWLHPILTAETIPYAEQQARLFLLPGG